MLRYCFAPQCVAQPAAVCTLHPSTNTLHSGHFSAPLPGMGQPEACKPALCLARLYTNWLCQPMLLFACASLTPEEWLAGSCRSPRTLNPEPMCAGPICMMEHLSRAVVATQYRSPPPWEAIPGTSCPTRTCEWGQSSSSSGYLLRLQLRLGLGLGLRLGLDTNAWPICVHCSLAPTAQLPAGSGTSWAAVSQLCAPADRLHTVTRPAPGRHT